MGKNVFTKYENYCEMTASRGLSVKISLEDCEMASQYQWHISDEGYATTRYYDERGKYANIRLHNLIMGKTPEGLMVDHINRNRRDNRRENLRFVDRQGNALNRDKLKSNTSGVNGVQKRIRKDGVVVYRPTININTKPKRLGTYKTMEEAIKVRKEAELKYYGHYID
jgi:hypothetical protein